jgi:hypothetical protein
MYLPQQYARKAEFVHALERSLDWSEIKNHFKAVGQGAAIRRSLPDKLRRRYEELKQRILSRRKRRAFGGYSVYDVLGAFKGKGGIAYDANSCVRIIDPIYLPRPKDLRANKLGTLVQRSSKERRRLFEAVIRTVCALRQHHEDNWPRFNWILNPTLSNENPTGIPKKDLRPIPSIIMTPAMRKIAEYFDDWIDEGSFLLYGFLGYHLHRAGPREEAIWLTSHFVVLNEYKRKHMLKRKRSSARQAKRAARGARRAS